MVKEEMSKMTGTHHGVLPMSCCKAKKQYVVTSGLSGKYFCGSASRAPVCELVV